MKLFLPVCCLLPLFFATCDAYSLIKLKENEEMCLRYYNSVLHLKKCSSDLDSMKWTYHVGDRNGAYGGGQLQNYYGKCLTNMDDPGSMECAVQCDVCDFAGPAYKETFAFYPAYKISDGSVEPGLFKIVHLGDNDCLYATGSTEGSEVRMRMCGNGGEMEKWKIVNAKELYENN